MLMYRLFENRTPQVQGPTVNYEGAVEAPIFVLVTSKGKKKSVSAGTIVTYFPVLFNSNPCSYPHPPTPFLKEQPNKSSFLRSFVLFFFQY